jgi:acetyl esterase/lipase
VLTTAAYYSVQALAPYVDPKADALSYYMMSKVARCPDDEFLHWCWQAYLGMEKSATDSPHGTTNTDYKEDEETTTTMEKLLKEGSNAKAWNTCKWNKDPIRRLARPVEGLGSLEVTDSCPKLLVTVNKADHLYSEGMEFAEEAMKIGLPALLFQHNGLHCSGSLYTDSKGNAKRMDAWADALFGKL